MTTNATGGIYAPLKQILSDSESEDDMKRLENAHRLKASESNNLDYNSGLHSSKNYSISDIDEFNTNVNTVESTMDNVSFLQSDISNRMSLARRCAFITSIVFCFLVVLIFVWGIPCSEIGICSNGDWHDKGTTWEFPFDEVEMSGAVQVVPGAQLYVKNLIMIYRGNHMKLPKFADSRNGVLLIVGNSGKVAWYTREDRILTEINCHLIDVNKDEINDCIVSGSQGLLAALDPLYGTYLWYIYFRPTKPFTSIAAIDFPVVMKDMDKDNVNDLLTVATVLPNTNHNALIIISGANGNVIGDPMIIEDCLSVKLFTESNSINYYCKNGTSEAVREITYHVLYRKLLKLDPATNHTLSTLPKMKKLNQGLKKNIGNTREQFTNGPGKLIVENSGECPDSCRVNVKLILERNGVTNVTWEYSANHVYAMKPSNFSFTSSIRGFVLKL